jgi:alpha-galactosidase
MKNAQIGLAVLIVAVSGFNTIVNAANMAWVSSLDLSNAKQGWGTPHADKSVNGNVLSIAGEKFEHGFGTHSVGRLVIDLHGNATHFHARVGIDDDAAPHKGTADFTVVGDGKQLWTSGILKHGDAAKTVDVDLMGIHQLQLRVGDGGDGFENDHADWADAKIEYDGTAPVTMEIKATEPTIAMPVAGVFPDLHVNPDAKLAATPPMGWNSYDGYGDSVTEEEMLANAKAVAAKLKPFGWQYVVVDYRWYDPGAFNNDPNSRAGVDLTMDEYGRLMPSPNRFPSAANGVGFKALADQIHGMGLKFGIHIMRGIPRKAVGKNLPILGTDFHAGDAADQTSTCKWCADMFGLRGETAAGQAYYDSLFKLYASWGLDFVKVDDLSRPYATNEVAAIRNAIDKCGRPIVFSTSPGAAPLDRAEHLKLHTNMWRATDDFWDNWHQLSDAMDVCASWNGHGGPGHWPDMDMLPLGRLSVKHRSVGPDRQTHFSHGEQLTLMTLWSLFPSPLMLGGDVTSADAWEIAILTNEEVLAVNQDPLGEPAMRVFNHAGLEVWERNLSGGKIAVGLFNRSEDDAVVSATWADLDLNGTYKVRDLWQKKDLPNADGKIESAVPAHCGGMFLLKRGK